ncbi:sigma-54-dependent Fis family transcriptional regulator [Alicyclobacillus kakegawensis]|uniref:sigma-54-dependent Fis family transcriptional regulator n=1 Tax=Alicyclobacillus kakegawensis TaxID=392012 RepID=UPI00082B9405|nr:sigma-54-dependent Fis family transcriptional regulator [Alicyclobacillus kakegawensis]
MSGPFLSKRIWRRFVEEGVLDSYRVSKSIAESWMRCRQSGVNPYDGRGRKILTGEALLKRKQQAAALQSVAAPHLRSLYGTLRGADVMVLLIDADGYVLSVVGDGGILAKAREINFVEGVRWTESEVGTNAIGTALIVGHPIILVGPEHYAVASQDWSCTAAPIHDTDGQLLGVIDVSGSAESAKLDTLAQVTLTAYAIEQEWRVREQEILSELLEKSRRLLVKSAVTRTVVTDARRRIVHMSPDLEVIGWHWFRVPLDELLNEGFVVRHSEPIYASGRANGENPIGYRVSVLPNAEASRRAFSRDEFRFAGETGKSEAFAAVLLDVRRVAETDAPVYISGESGTGKELIARAIHDNSQRRRGPFVAVNCGAVPDNLIESELFGYVEGAFTGARKGGYKGKLAQAHGGTLFLDEVEAMPHTLQVALLRALQEREVTPIGGTKPERVDFRVVSASNRNLWDLVKAGRFREDLYYRICVYPLTVPPLRDRKEDIPQLVRYYCRRHDWSVKMPEEILQRLTAYDWPGNVRELLNVLEQIRIRAGSGVPHVAHLPPFLRDVGQDGIVRADRKPIVEREEEGLSYRQRVQKTAMMRALEQSGGNVTKAAWLLNMPRSTFYRRMRKFGL